jgi:DNA repair exonuclease SbcCD ATPase subunit
MSGDGFVIQRVDVVNFGPYHAKTWEPGPARLSVIVGKSGVGKSTLIVDAPLFALYGEVPDGSPPDRLVRIGAAEMSVTVEFTLGGQLHRVVRRRTSRAGGKSSADLQARISDGTWKPEASGADAVTAEVIRLLRMDKHTFRTVVVLAQGDAKRFMKATPGKGEPGKPGRAAILSTIVVDPRFALAEVAARKEATELEANTAADRRSMQALDATLSQRAELEAAAAAAKAEEEVTVAAMEAAGRRRDAAEEMMRSLAGRLAEAKAAQDEIARIDADLVALRDRYRRAGEARAAAKAAIERTKAAAEAEVPEHDVEATRAGIADLEAAAEMERDEREKLDLARAALRDLEAAHERKKSDWRTIHARAAGLVAALEDQGMHLAPVTCPKCATRFPADPGDVAGRLDAARAALRDIGPEPAEPMTIARDRVAIFRSEQRLAEGAIDPAALRSAREALAAAERAAAALVARDGARAALADAEAGLARIDVELAEIDATGKAAAVTRAKAAERADAAFALGQQVAAAEQTRLESIRAASDAAKAHSAAIAANAEARGALLRLERDQAERDRIVGDVAQAEVVLARLRRLVVAFGVKGIPARVVESVLPELVAHANEMLGQLRPGMTLDLRATRAKADGSGTIEALDIWIRDEKGERQRWSGGEETSIAIAIATGLSRLGARRSGARVATQILDEPDGLDADNRRDFGQALRVLAHRGDLERVAVITHQDGIPDFADDVVEISQDEDLPGPVVVAV